MRTQEREGPPADRREAWGRGRDTPQAHAEPLLWSFPAIHFLCPFLHFSLDWSELITTGQRPAEGGSVPRGVSGYLIRWHCHLPMASFPGHPGSGAGG